MSIRSVRTLVMAAALLLAFAVSSNAQTVGVGLSFLEGGTGVTLDYAKPHKTISNDRTLSWVGDFSFHHEGAGNDFVGGNVSLNILTFQGGLRMQGAASDKVTWHVQGLAGIARASVNVSAAGLTEDICDLFDLDCEAGASDTSVVVSPGAGINYALDDKKALRAQLDFIIGEGTGTRFWIGLSFKLGN